MSKRNKGTGTIYYREDRKVYEGRIKVGTKYNGKPIYKHVTCKRKTEVQTQLVKLKAQIDAGTFFEPSKQKLKTWLNVWLNTYMRDHIREQTFNTYRTVIDKIIVPLIGDVQLKSLTPLMLQQAFNELSQKYAPSTLRKVKSMLKMAFHVAKDNELILKDLLSGLKLPKLEKPQIESIAVCDIGKLLAQARKYHIYEAIVIGLGTGMRPGELLVLEWQDVDLIRAEVKVSKTLIRCKDERGKETLKAQHATKTDCGYRTIPLSQDNVRLLKALKKKRFAQGFKDNGIMFCSLKGTYLNPRNYNRALETICKNAGIKRITANITRHTFATIAIERNAEVKTVSEILGHRRVETTYNNYVHPSLEKRREVAELMTLSTMQNR